MAMGPAQARQLLQTVRNAPRALKIIAMVAAIDAAVLIFAALSLEGDVDARIDRVAALHSQLNAQRQKIEATRKEIDRLPELRRSYDAAINSGVLADQDRLKLVSLAQDLANQHRLIDLHYRLSPEEVAQLTGSKYRLVSTEVALTDGAVVDGDVFQFWDEILDKSPAHYQVTKFTLQRLDADLNSAVASIRAGHPISLVKAELDFKWISLRQPVEAIKAADAAGSPPPKPATGANAVNAAAPAPTGASK